MKILGASVVDLASNERRSMPEALEEILAPLLQRDVVASFTDSCLKHTFFYNIHSRNAMVNWVDNFRFSAFSLKTVLSKNRVTNSVGGGSNLKYVFRKIRL